MTYNKNDPESIQAMFGTIAKRYDRANAVLSLQMHKKWNSELVRLATAHHPDLLLDLCSGTGDIAFAYLKKASIQKRAYLLDFCAEMLECARQKADQLNLQHHMISYIQADAQQIPLEDRTIPCATMAYGIRNIKDPLKCIQEVYRVLKPGAVFGILELTRPVNPVMRIGHHLYLKTILPLLGKWMTANQDAYEYLCQSIHHFNSETLEDFMRQSGFEKILQKKLTGGIATILLGFK